jgi:hypothetical protein
VLVMKVGTQTAISAARLSTVTHVTSQMFNSQLRAYPEGSKVWLNINARNNPKFNLMPPNHESNVLITESTPTKRLIYSIYFG